VVLRAEDHRRLRGFFCSGAEVLAEPLAHLVDGLVHLGYASGAQDEGVLAFGHRVDLGGDLEVCEAAAELGAVVGEGLVLAVVDGRGGRPVRSAFTRLIWGSVKSTAGSCSQVARKSSRVFLLSILSVSSFASTDGFWMVRSVHGETLTIAPGVASPLASRRSGSITARDPPIEWPVLPMLRGW